MQEAFSDKGSNKPPRPQNQLFQLRKEGPGARLSCRSGNKSSIKRCSLVLPVNTNHHGEALGCEWFCVAQPDTPSQQCKCSGEGKGWQCAPHRQGNHPNRPGLRSWGTRAHSPLAMTQFIPTQATSALISQMGKLNQREGSDMPR